MRRVLWLAGVAVLLLAGCGGPSVPKGYTRLVLLNPAWDQVHVNPLTCMPLYDTAAEFAL